MIGERMVEGFSALTLATPGRGGIEATFVPDAGMVGCSLRHREEELLGQRGGVRAYVAERSTMGIPLLYPWANRLTQRRFSVADRDVDLASDALPLGCRSTACSQGRAAGGWSGTSRWETGLCLRRASTSAPTTS